ncbi:MAG: sugar ABC transporter permease [Lachnospiraceae bacterium]|nr:sugar ABC transporter permease [Lachnospiraceae bacterium]
MRLNKEARIGICIFLLPAVFLFAVFFIYPVFYVIVRSFTKWNGITAPVFNGIENYQKILSDPVFLHSLRNNVIWAVCAVVVQVGLALLMAMILSKQPVGWKFFRTVYFLPQVISGVALAAMWGAVYNSDYGLLNGILKAIGLGKHATNWLGNPKTAFPCVLIYGLFYIGYYMTIIMAGIANVPQDYYEAARIDGASELQIDFYITIPIIKSSIQTCVLLAAVFGLRTFENIYLLTNGGPANKTSVIVLYLYNKMRNNKYGIANASSVVLIMLGVVVIVAIRTIFAHIKTDEEH